MKFTGFDSLPEHQNSLQLYAIVKIRCYPDEFRQDIVYRKMYERVGGGDWSLAEHYQFHPTGSLENQRTTSWLGSRVYVDWLKLVGVLPEKLENLVNDWYTADEVEKHIIILEPEIIHTKPTSDWHTWFDPTGKYGSEPIKNPFYQECNFEMDGNKYYRMEKHYV